MKTRIAMAAVMVLAMIQFSAAKEPVKHFATPEEKVAFASKNLLCGVQSTNDGVIESAMRVTAQMKIAYPSTNVSDLKRAITGVLKNHPSGTIRYKAYIALSVCEHPEWYTYENDTTAENEMNFYRTASAQMQRQLLSDNR